MLDFLKNIKVDDPELMKKQGKGGGGNRKQWNPTEGLKLRVWKSGAIFPSEQLVAWFNLEYRAKGADVQGNGLDVFSSTQFPIFKGADRPLILVNVTPKESAKVDLFGTVGYVKEAEVGETLPEGVTPGEPITSVMDQGAVTFGKEDLLPMIKETYGLEPNEDGYIDLQLVGADGIDATEPFKLPDGKVVCHVPKTISRGKKAGEPDYRRRDNPRLYMLYPASMLEEAESTEDKGEPQ